MRYIILFIAAFLYGYVGTISALVGKAEIVRGNSKLVAKVGQKVEKQDKIYTFDNTKMQIIFKDETVITIGKNSVFKVEDYAFDNEPKAKFNLAKGIIKTLTGKIGKIAPKRFNIKTKNALIGIRGTEFYVESLKNITKVGVIFGKVEFRSLLDNKSFVVDTGKMLVFKPKAPKKVIIKKLDVKAFKLTTQVKKAPTTKKAAPQKTAAKNTTTKTAATKTTTTTKTTTQTAENTQTQTTENQTANKNVENNAPEVGVKVEGEVENVATEVTEEAPALETEAVGEIPADIQTVSEEVATIENTVKEDVATTETTQVVEETIQENPEIQEVVENTETPENIETENIETAENEADNIETTIEETTGNNDVTNYTGGGGTTTTTTPEEILPLDIILETDPCEYLESLGIENGYVLGTPIEISGTSNGDGEVKVYVNGELYTTVNSDGSWVVTLSNLAEGENDIKVILTDNDGTKEGEITVYVIDEADLVAANISPRPEYVEGEKVTVYQDEFLSLGWVVNDNEIVDVWIDGDVASSEIIDEYVRNTTSLHYSGKAYAVADRAGDLSGYFSIDIYNGYLINGSLSLYYNYALSYYYTLSGQVTEDGVAMGIYKDQIILTGKAYGNFYGDSADVVGGRFYLHNGDFDDIKGVFYGKKESE